MRLKKVRLKSDFTVNKKKKKMSQKWNVKNPGHFAASVLKVAGSKHAFTR